MAEELIEGNPPLAKVNDPQSVTTNNDNAVELEAGGTVLDCKNLPLLSVGIEANSSVDWTLQRGFSSSGPWKDVQTGSLSNGDDEFVVRGAFIDGTHARLQLSTEGHDVLLVRRSVPFDMRQMEAVMLVDDNGTLRRASGDGNGAVEIQEFSALDVSAETVDVRQQNELAVFQAVTVNSNSDSSKKALDSDGLQEIEATVFASQGAIEMKVDFYDDANHSNLVGTKTIIDEGSGVSSPVSANAKCPTPYTDVYLTDTSGSDNDTSAAAQAVA